MLALKKLEPMDKIGFYVTNSIIFNKFKKECPEIESDSYFLLKEWEIIKASKDNKIDINLLTQYEKQIGRPFLWNALVADRRIYFGKKYAYTQDYNPRFTHEQMLAILQIGVKRIEELFDEVQPDFIVSFQCVTIGEYLSSLFAQSRSIPLLNLRPTRIKNYFYAGENIMEPSDYLKEVYNQHLKNGIDSPHRENAIKYLREVQKTHAMYEGVIPPSNKPPASVNLKKRIISVSKIKELINLLIGEYKYRFGEYRFDNHISGFIEPVVNRKIIRPLRAKQINKHFHNQYITSKDLQHLNYAFFPLHTDPEVTLSVYSKPYLNQIEAARLFSHNLPIGMKLMIKEHPWAIGKRPLSYYNKLKAIPNVILAHPSLSSRELVSNAKLITIIAGSIGLEGLIMKKPVVVLGRTPFNFLTPDMIRHVYNPDKLGEEIRNLLENHKYNENALLCYFGAVMKNSINIDFYSRLLGRKGVYREESQQSYIDENKERKKQIEALAKYILNRYRNINSYISKLSNNIDAVH